MQHTYFGKQLCSEHEPVQKQTPLNPVKKRGKKMCCCVIVNDGIDVHSTPTHANTHPSTSPEVENRYSIGTKCSSIG